VPPEIKERGFFSPENDKKRKVEPAGQTCLYLAALLRRIFWTGELSKFFKYSLILASYYVFLSAKVMLHMRNRKL